MPLSTGARRRGTVAAAVLLVLAFAPAAAAHAGDRGGSGDPGVLLHWNALSWQTIGVEGAKPPPIAQLYLGLVSTAVYNAVVTAEDAGRPTLPQPRIEGHASSDVAAATAAHDVLIAFFPASAGALDAEYTAWLAGVPDSRERERGLQAGHDAAEALIASRVDDGREDPTVILQRPAEPPPGIWVPTGNGEWTSAWLGFTRPLHVESATQFAPDGPDDLMSAEYAQDFAEVQLMGAAMDSGRSADDTELALFWNDNPPRQYQDAMRARALEHGMDIVEAARMFGAVNASAADTMITCWRAKWDTNFWRPLTAIQQAERDGNPATSADPSWNSFRPAPPYPEYPSGHGCISSATAEALEELFGKGNLDMTITSTVPEVAGQTRHYDDADEWLADVTDARIFLGYHFRDGMDDAVVLGEAVAEHVVDCWFESWD
jgi:hypothetical protein